VYLAGSAHAPSDILRVMDDRRNRKFASEGIRRRVNACPRQTGASRRPRKQFASDAPSTSESDARRRFSRAAQLVGTRITAHEMILLVKDFKFDRTLCIFREVIIMIAPSGGFFPAGIPRERVSGCGSSENEAPPVGSNRCTPSFAVSAFSCRRGVRSSRIQNERPCVATIKSSP